GDPKQAIYRFRGADVFTYMRARRQCEQSDRLYGLTENYRSTGALLDAFNALFEGRDNPFEYEQIPYSHVTSGREVAALNAKGDAACTVLWHAGADAKILKDEAARIAADVCATEIARLLELGASGRAHYPKDGNTQRVEAKDIAVLVDKNRQGLAVQLALRRYGIAAAMVATASVFAGEEAEELQIVLAAVAEPANGALLRRALATRLLGATASDLAAWANDEPRWGAIVSNFRDYHALWQSRGFAAMFARLIAEEGVIERTLARDDGERVMTNLRQLAELAGEQAAHCPGIASLLVWFARERANVAKAEDRQLRLESDENLVRIATVHKAKGLEYPIVFLPFLWDGKQPDKKTANPAVLAHDEDYRSVLDLGSEHVGQRQEDAAQEARSEEARKLYVALTRAQRACYLIAMPANQLELTALARMLNVDAFEELQPKLQDWTKAAGGSVKIRAPLSAGATGQLSSARPHGQAREFPFADRLRQRFFVASYSRLAEGARGASAEAPDRDETVATVPAPEQAKGIHAFPAGPASGTFMHAVIEALDFDADENAISEAVRSQSAFHGIEPRWNETLTGWLLEIFATPLGAPGCALRDIRRERRIDELEFYFPLNAIRAPALDEALRQFSPQGPRPSLQFDDVQGLMKGYLDLVFEQGGRYWITDYKSNRLGSDLAAYTPQALDRAMGEHRYDLQYLIYTVALHRYLATRIADYDYDRHFGGVLYLFLRGMAPVAPEPRGVWHTRPEKSDVERLDAYLAGAVP
ncbi:MAG TPA: 3'-5' exonuclease, partial [Gammaproteobacteria bacterium]|nr:3'-5' exonuclease [Gammaproteobacteria bacterium]